MNKLQQNVLYCCITIHRYGSTGKKGNRHMAKIFDKTKKTEITDAAAKPQPRPEKRDVIRVQPDPKVGLSAEQVQERIDAGQQNFDSTPATRTEKQIVIRNICTLFNLVNIIFFVAILAVGSVKDTLFMAIVAANTAIGIIQEIRAKRSIDQLSFLTAAKAKVLRGGEKQEIPIEEIVLDDIIILSAGDQVPTDCVVASGFCEADESFLTGESDAISKNINDTLLAGSFIVSGSVHARAEHVSSDNYISKISTSAKTVKKKVNSEIMRTMQAIVAVISIALIPISVILFRNQLALPDATMQSSVLNTTAALIAMVPEGLMLLTSTVLAASVVRLSQQHVMVQELYCIETLARVDVLCLDKTGTITEGTMDCTDTILLDDAFEQDVPKALGSLVAALEDRNATFTAIAAKFTDPTPWRAEKTAPFSSRTKWSGATFEGYGTYILGAAEFVMPARDLKLQEALYEYSQDNRVLLLAHSDEALPSEGLPGRLQPIALILLQDNIRKAAPATLRYFKEQGVTCKVISGDSVETVSGIARRAGVDNWDKCIDMSKVSKKEIPEVAEQYTVFGRVTPEQKKLLVKALQKKGHTVAMTGNGVNDVMALKEADCGIAIAGGADAARNVAQLVLLKSNFEALPKVVAEGRRSINNIQRSASLFLVKTVYATILSVAFIFITAPYPFQPIHLTLIGFTTTGLPSVILGLQPNHERVQGHFLKNVLTTAAPCGITIALAVLLTVLCGQAFQLAQAQVEAMCVLLTGGAILILLFYVCHPWTPVRVALFGSMTFLFFLGYFGFNQFFSIVRFVPSSILLLALIGIGSWEIFRILWQIFHGQHITLVPKPAADYEHPAPRGKRERRR